MDRPDEVSESKESGSEGVATRRFITRPGSGKVLDISRSPLVSYSSTPSSGAGWCIY